MIQASAELKQHPTAQLPLSKRSDDDLVRELKGGNREEAMSVILERHSGYLRSIARKQLRLGSVRCPQTEDDVLQGVSINIFSRIHQYEVGTSFVKWITTITNNFARSELRKLKVRPRECSALARPQNIGEDDWNPIDIPVPATRELEEHELSAALDSALEELSVPMRAAFQKCVEEGKEYATAAEELGMKPRTLATNLRRGRIRILQKVGHLLDEVPKPPDLLLKVREGIDS